MRLIKFWPNRSSVIGSTPLFKRNRIGRITAPRSPCCTDPEHVVDVKEDSPVRRRLAYDELLAKQLAMALVRERNRGTGGRALSAKGDYVEDVLKGAPFPPTGAQARAVEEIKADMASPNRMSRLLQGDVGAGKTFVAALACAYAAEAGVQVALMAPTEILARQHVETLRTVFWSLPV